MAPGMGSDGFIRGGGTPHNDLYGEAPRERGIFLGVRYKNG